MGNGISCRRTSRTHQHHPPHLPIPPGYPNSYVAPSDHLPSVNTFPRSQGYNQFNGQFLMNLSSGSALCGAEASASATNSSPSYIREQQEVSTIRNDVNVNKTSLRLEKDEQNPGFYLLAFTFDAIVPGSICIFFRTKEGPDFSLIPLRPLLFKPVHAPFKEGLGQEFRQAVGTGVNLSAFETSDLTEVRHGEIFPLAVRTETNAKDSSTDASPRQTDDVGGPLPKWVNAQTTLCVLDIKDDEVCVKVVKQVIWVDGLRYELQEIYGIENSAGGDGFDISDSGKECVICLAEQRDTTVLPCRHMCMCNACAQVLRRQTNRCPICRTPVAKLLEIKVPSDGSSQNSGKV